MIAVDSSSLIAFFNGLEGPDVEALTAALASSDVLLPPVVIAEVLSDQQIPPALVRLLRSLPILELLPGYWERAGRLRARVRSNGRRTPLADMLIAQSCLDHDVSLITRDHDFKSLSPLIELRLQVQPVVPPGDTPTAGTRDTPTPGRTDGPEEAGEERGKTKE